MRQVNLTLKIKYFQDPILNTCQEPTNSIEFAGCLYYIIYFNLVNLKSK